MKLPAGSYSFHKDYTNCPRKAWHTYIARDVERGENAMLLWGNKVHKALELYLNDGEMLPDSMRHYEHLYNFPAGYDVEAEKMLAIRENGLACDFFDPDAYVRGKLDVVLLNPLRAGLAIIIDHKTGKKREDPGELKVHAVLLQAHYPDLENIKGWYNWLQSAEMGRVHDLSDTEATLNELRRTRERITSAYQLGEQAFPPRQNPLCRWCPVRSCKFNPQHAG
jgi:CRISPR/Cas system-associated exonuclease Cas4 (RecB family)